MENHNDKWNSKIKINDLTEFITNFLKGFWPALRRLLLGLVNQETPIKEGSFFKPNFTINDEPSPKIAEQSRFQLNDIAFFYNPEIVFAIHDNLEEFLKSIEFRKEQDIIKLREFVDLIDKTFKFSISLLSDENPQSETLNLIKNLWNEFKSAVKKTKDDGLDSDSFIDVYVRPLIHKFLSHFFTKVQNFIDKFNQIISSIKFKNLPNDIQLELKKVFIEPFIQNMANNPVLNDFYSLINKAINKNKPLASELMKNFIECIKNSNSNNPKQDIMPESAKYKQLEMREKFLRQNFQTFGDIGRKFGEFITSPEFETFNLDSDSPIYNDRLLADMNNYIARIADRYESLRYIIGFMIGLFDIIEYNSLEHSKSYFSKNHFVFTGLYGANRRTYDTDRKTLVRYPKGKKKPTLSEYFKKYTEYQELSKYLKFHIKIFNDIRIHNAHHKTDIEQDKIKDGIFKIFDKKCEYKEYKNVDIFHLLSEISGFFQFMMIFIYFNSKVM